MKQAGSMKIIKSLGGPLIGLPIGAVDLWGGADQPSFAGLASGFPNDYEAAGFLTDGRDHPPCDVAVMRGPSVDGILITMPSETCILSATPSLVKIAQIHAAEHDWSFSDLDTNFFRIEKFDDCLDFKSGGSQYILFDSVFSAIEIDNYIDFSLENGIYTISSASVERELYSLTLIRIDRKLAGVGL